MHPKFTPKDIARFWSKVDKSGPCWLWMGCLVKGYGQFRCQGHTLYAHRVAWELTHGPIPDGMFVLHNCPIADNPSCVLHLWLGTNIDNAQDAAKKGQLASGELNGHAHLTPVIVGEIRAHYADGGMGYKRLAKQFGISQTQVRNIISRRQWKHIP